MRRQLPGWFIAVLIMVLAAAQPAAGQTTIPPTTSTTVATAATRAVTYIGVTFSVPSNWPVFDLTADPSQCVRFDRPAVYLGHAGPDPRCPSRLIGRADGLQMEPADTKTAIQVAKATVATTLNGESVKTDPSAATDGQVRLVVPRLGVLVTLSRSPFTSDADQVLNSFQAGSTPSGVTAPSGGALPARAGASAPSGASAVSPAAPATPTAAPAATAAPVAADAPTARRGPTSYVGEGFDACTAPSAATMASWLASPYRSVGIYIAGALRACSQANLTPQWIATVTNQGWLLVPIYVGLQAPCNQALFGSGIIDAQKADSQGRAAADEAVNAAAALGLVAGTPIYNDMEGYDTTVAGCSQAVLSFLQGWTSELHGRGYLSGVYGSSNSAITDLIGQYNNSSYSTPDDIWFANWSCCAHSVTGDSRIPAGDWSPHRRLHQYTGGHDETYGGVTINVDSDYDDGDLTGAIPGYVLDGWGAVHPFGGAPGQPGGSYWPGQDVTRGVVLQPNGDGGYVLDDWGGVHPFGGAPPASGFAYWPGQDVARALALNPCDSTGTSGYVLDDWGGVHPFGGAPSITISGYWPGWDIARGLTMNCLGGRPVGQVLEGWGGLHPVGDGPSAAGEAYWPGQDVAVGVALTGPTSGYTLDSWGAIHEFGGAPGLPISAYWPGTRMARGLSLTHQLGGGYVLDAYGGVHRFGSAAPQNVGTFPAPLARGIVLAG